MEENIQGFGQLLEEDASQAPAQETTSQASFDSVPPGTPVIIDIGEASCKVGFAGNEEPVAVFPTIVGKEKYKAVMVDTQEHTRTSYVGEDCANMRGVLKINYPISRGAIVSWEDYYEILSHIFYNVLRVDPRQHPVVYIEHTLTPPDTRNYIAQVLYDTYGVQSLYMANADLLSLFSVGLTSGLVVDIGEGLTFIVPVANGELYYQGIIKNSLGSVDVSEYLRNLLLRYGQSLEFSAQKEILREIKEQNCYVALNPDKEREQGLKDTAEYPLPDGETIPIDGETRYQAAEVLFQPGLLGYNIQGVPQLVIQALSRIDFTWRREMIEHVVVCGGATCLTGFDLRLERELENLLPQLGPIPEPVQAEPEPEPEPEPLSEPKLQDVDTPEREVDTCPKCGKTVNLIESGGVCPDCGHNFKGLKISISPIGAKKTELPDECTECGKKLEEESLFCPFCGAKIEPVEKPGAGLGAVEFSPVMEIVNEQETKPQAIPLDVPDFDEAEEFKEEGETFEETNEFAEEEHDTPIKIFPPENRVTAAFKGAAILGSLPSFQTLFVTREQFQADPSLIYRSFSQIF